MTNQLIVLPNTDIPPMCSGRTLTIGAEYAELDKRIRDYTCTAHLEAAYIYQEISFETFRFVLSRMRSRENNLVTKGDCRKVYVNLQAIHFGKDVIELSYKNSEDIRDWINLVEDRWYKFWREQ